MAALVDRPLLRRERRGRDAALPDARDDRRRAPRLWSRVSRASPSAADPASSPARTSLSRARTRSSASPRCGSGSSRPSSRRSCSPHRAGRRAALLPHRRALRCRRRRSGSGSCTRSPTTSTRAVERVVDHLLAAGPEAVRAAKRLIRERPVGEASAHSPRRSGPSPEGQEGLRAFLEKRAATLPSGAAWGVYSGEQKTG